MWVGGGGTNVTFEIKCFLKLQFRDYIMCILLEYGKRSVMVSNSNNNHNNDNDNNNNLLTYLEQ